MIGLDTNVIVRYLAQDDPRQSAAATRLMEKALSPDEPGFITLITMCEVVWVLEGPYKAGRDRIRSVVEALLGTRQIEVESAELVWKALRTWERSVAGFSDALIGEVCAAKGARKVVTFDKAAAKLPSFELLA